MKIIFFAQARQAAGCAEAFLRVERPLSASEFWDHLLTSFGGLEPLRKAIRLARNEEYLTEDALLQPDDEIVLIPPVSGG